MSTSYTLICQVCGKEFNDDGVRLACDVVHEPGLLITRYATRFLEPISGTKDIFRYQNWLPVSTSQLCAGRTVVYQSKQLSKMINLPQLWIAFNGYWPDKGAFLETTTFKDLEAYTVLARLARCSHHILVIASAGNTAAAFALACSRSRAPCLIILPASGLQKLCFVEPLDSCVKIVALTEQADYYDAIRLANRFADCDGFVLEGGGKNVARRDGLGTILLNAVEAIGQLPRYYFQAIGSGAGGIAVYEMAQRLLQDGRFGCQLPRLFLSQNSPFLPIYTSWKAQQKQLIVADQRESKQQIQKISAQVLSNRYPLYDINGGVFDALTASQGDMLSATNAEVASAMSLFQTVEGIDIDPAAGVALATLQKAVCAGLIEKEAPVLLNISGGGWAQRARSYHLMSVQPTLLIHEYEIGLVQTMEKICSLFS